MNHENLTEQSQNQRERERETDLSAKNGQTCGSIEKEGDNTASSVPDTGYLEPRDNMGIIMEP